MRWIAALVAVLLAVPLLAAPAAGGASKPAAGRGVAGHGVAAPAGPVAAIVMDVKTGQVLYARDMHRRWPPASTTKVLSAMLAIERLRLDTMVPISSRAAAQRNGSSIGLEVGEQWSVGDLLHAMIMRSANDAAVAVAEASWGSVERFAAAMNARARRLGARNSHFVNPHGLHDPDHYSTAYDLALIARYALRHPTFASLVRTPTWVLARGDRPPQELVNSNKLLGRYAGADGVKTGWIAASGPCLVASATRDGWRLLAVVLNSQEVYRDAEQLLDYGFQSFALLRVAGRGDPLATLTVGWPRLRVEAVVPADVHAVVRHGARVTSRIRMRSDLRLPIAAGERVGEVEFLTGQNVVARSVLVAARTVAR